MELCEEVYVTVREAIRNALVHSGTERLDVTVTISELELRARVSDTGRGFSVEETKGWREHRPVLDAGKDSAGRRGATAVQPTGTRHDGRILDPARARQHRGIPHSERQTVTIDTEVISAVLVDDHTLFRDGLAELLASDATVQVVAQGGDGEAAVALVAQHRPDVVLLDVEMPGPGAQVTLNRLRQANPETRVVVVTMHDRPELARELVDRHGAAAYLVKTVGGRELIASVHSVVASRNNVVVSVSRSAVDQLDNPHPNGTLSARELEVLKLAALAMSNAQIAKQLVITEGTVKHHLTNIYKKLHAVSRVDAIRKATAVQLIPHSDA